MFWISHGRMLGVAALVGVLLQTGVGYTQDKIASIDGSASPATFSIRAEETYQRDARTPAQKDYWNTSFSGNKVIIDTMMRFVGGDSLYMETAAGRIKTPPALKFPFTISSKQTVSSPTLTIGLVDGINSAEAHDLGQSATEYVSTPMTVKLNGRRILSVATNGESLRFKIPNQYLNPNGYNIIQVEAGYYFPEANRIAYDRLQVQGLGIEL